MLPAIANAKAPLIGAPFDGGVFIYREAVDMYWNDWVAYPLQDKKTLPSAGQVHLTIIGEGKTAVFIGNVSVNCKNGNYLWESASDSSEILADETDIKSAVPFQVINNTIQLFCIIPE